MGSKDEVVCNVDNSGRLSCLPKHAQRVARIAERFGRDVDPPVYNVAVNGKWVGEWVNSKNISLGAFFSPTSFPTRKAAENAALVHARDSVETELDVYESYGSFPEDRAVVWNKRMVLGREETADERRLRKADEEYQMRKLQNQIAREAQEVSSVGGLALTKIPKPREFYR